MDVRAQLEALDPETKRAFQAYIGGLPKPPAPPAAPQPIAPQTISPMQNYELGRRQRAANSQYMQGLATNQFNRGQRVQQYGMDRADLIRQFALMREQLPYAANRRGLLGSGIWRRQLKEHATNQLQGLGRLDLAHTGQLGELDLLRQQLEQRRVAELSDVDEQRAALLQQLALRLT